MTSSAENNVVSNKTKRIAELSVAQATDYQDIDACNRAMLKENYGKEFYDSLFASQSSCSFVLRVETEPTEKNSLDSDSATVEKVKVSEEPLKNTEFAGYVLAGLNYDAKGRIVCHIISLAVHKKFQRQGFARVLMQSVEAFIRNRQVHHMILHVRKHNKAAYNLYTKLQYGRSKVVKAYYTNPKEDAYEMKKYLDSEAPQQRPNTAGAATKD